MQDLIETAKFSQSSHATSKHNHLSCELIFVRRGEAEFIFHDKCVTAKEGTVILITALEEHSVTIKSQPYERYFIILSPNNLQQIHSAPKLISIFSRRSNSGVFTFDVSNTMQNTEELFYLISNEQIQKNIYHKEMQASLIEQLLIILYRSNSDNFDQIREIDRKMFDVQRYIDDHYMDVITINELSQTFYMSKSYLTHAFKECCGYTPQKYLILVRLLNAKQLLSSTDKPINEISSEIGFSDINNFIRTFKKAFGVTPKAFRKENNN